MNKSPSSCAVFISSRAVFISFHFISFHFALFISSRAVFISFHFISFHFISLCSFQVARCSFHFISFHFISFRFVHFKSRSLQLKRGKLSGTVNGCVCGTVRVCSGILRNSPEFSGILRNSPELCGMTSGTCVFHFISFEMK
jgi:hypothetical protein